MLVNAENETVSGLEVAKSFVEHYKNFIGTHVQPTNLLNTMNLFTSRISEVKANQMIRQVTAEEIKEAMFNIGDDKAPGPDGYTAAFFKASWNIIGPDVVDAIKEFFEKRGSVKGME